MRLLRLQLTNFGPFKGVQEIEFGDANGVVVIYGENNLGKTTLLNSVRWLFVGKYLERTGKERSHAALVNREAVAEANGGEVTARVRADVSWSGDAYSIMRSVIEHGDRTTERLDVIRGSDVLSREAADSIVRQMMPEEIQQFFLFDAEALNRYEDLLHDPAAGDGLKTAIERILGVPVLKNGVEDIKALIAEHNKVIAKLNTQDAKARQAAHSLAQLNEVIDQLTVDQRELQGELDDATSERSKLEARMAETERAQRLLANERQARRAVETAQDHHDAMQIRYKEAAPRAWQAIVTSTLQTKLDTIRDEIADLELRQRRVDRERLIHELRGETQASGTCPCCGQPAALDHIAELQALDDCGPAIAALQQGQRALEAAVDVSAVTLLQERWQALEEAAARLHDAHTELQDATEAIEGLTDTDLADLPRRLTNAREKQRLVRANLADTKRQLEENSGQAEKLAAIVAEQGGAAGAEATQKQALLADIQHLLTSAIDTYRENLKERVEREASNVFCSVRSDPDFVGLSINDDYGLTIRHVDGELEPHRSAGYEHIVALSLVAALQRCAPVQGPIFMDMPFARLDPNHTLKTLSALPSIADQLVLIVHEGEIDHNEAVTLGADLVLERKLVRRSARHTDIRPLGDS